jgi:hypothetical protein
MPLNRVTGETVEHMDGIFRIVPTEKYQHQPRLTTTVKRMRGKKFRREVDVEMPVWQAALEHAQMAFYNAGAAPGALDYDTIVQEYPRTGVICFLFAAIIGGVEMLVSAPFQLSHQQIAGLTVRNLWQPYRAN